MPKMNTDHSKNKDIVDILCVDIYTYRYKHLYMCIL